MSSGIYLDLQTAGLTIHDHVGQDFALNLVWILCGHRFGHVLRLVIGHVLRHALGHVSLDLAGQRSKQRSLAAARRAHNSGHLAATSDLL